MAREASAGLERQMMPATAYKEGVDPRNWFVQRVRAQAEREGVVFTSFEQRYLSATEQGDDASAIKMLDGLERAQFRELSDRMTGLLLRRYEADTQSRENAAEEYEAALRGLNDIDEDNFAMFANEVGLKRIQQELKPQLLRLLFVVIAVIVLVLIAVVVWRR